jgi:endonuclease/exonuclease/phosphatase family metal-dependent hydrolase
LDVIGTKMRLATFNIESLDAPPRAHVQVSERAEVLRPQLVRLNADILCLQEVNSQRLRGGHTRTLEALEDLLTGTQYASYARAATDGARGGALADIHNLVTLSRFPICSYIELKHTLISPLTYQAVTAIPNENMLRPVFFERPALVVEVELQHATKLTVTNLHLRAPLASVIPGQKQSPLSWKSTSGWAEGYFLSSLKRSAQALEIRLAVDHILDADPHSLIAICGDFNAEDYETPLKLLQATEDDTGNSHLAARTLVTVDHDLPQDRRFSVLHRGRPQMLDHILVTRNLAAHLKGVHVHNESLTDESEAPGGLNTTLGSYHAPLVAEFSIE